MSVTEGPDSAVIGTPPDMTSEIVIHGESSAPARRLVPQVEHRNPDQPTVVSENVARQDRMTILGRTPTNTDHHHKMNELIYSGDPRKRQFAALLTKLGAKPEDYATLYDLLKTS